jgi:hypothetical protein
MDKYINRESIKRWIFPPNTLTPTLYKHNEEYVTILYSKCFQIPKTKNDLYKFTREEFIGYCNLFGFSISQPLKLQHQRTCLCDICGNIYQSINYILNLGYTYYICDNCIYRQYNVKHLDYYVNKRFIKNDILIDLVEDQYDILSYYNNNIYIYYHRTFKFIKFNYNNVLYEPWYQRNNDSLCKYCKLKPKTLNSMCIECLNFSYQITFKNVIIGWLSFKNLFNNDINCYIFTILLQLLDYHVNLIDLSKMVNPLTKHDENNKNETKEEEEDLITEENLYSYVKFDLNDLDYEDLEDNIELGYWDD